MRNRYFFQNDWFVVAVSIISLSILIGASVKHVEASPIIVNRNTVNQTEGSVNALQMSCTPSMTVAAGDVAGLIAAIDCANTQPNDDVINLTASIYTLTAVNNVMAGENGLPIIQNNGSLTIYGHGSTISQNNLPSLRLLMVSAGANVTIDGLTLSHGVAFPPNNGGAILNSGTLAVTNTTVISNWGDLGGGIYNNGTMTLTNDTISNNTGGPAGGGVANFGSLSITNTIISGNAADIGGGLAILGGTVTMSGATISNNRAILNGGGGIYNNGTITQIINTKILDNTATTNGDGISNSGTINMSQSCLVGNSAGLYNSGTVVATNNWWGSITGPAGDGTGSGDGVIGTYNFMPYLKQAIMNCPYVNGVVREDVYYTSAGIPIVANGQGSNPKGVLGNDTEVPTALLLDPSITYSTTTLGALNFNPDGTFTYTPNNPNIGDVDAFRYRGQDAGGKNLPSTLVCISISNLKLTAPPSAQTSVNQPIPIKGIHVTSPDPNQIITLQLEVQHGTLQIQGSQVNVDLQTCRERLGLQTTARPLYPHTGVAAPALQNSGSSVTISGTENELNPWLDTLVYTPNAGFVGVDNLIIIANDTSDGFVQANVVIYVIGESSSAIIPNAVPIGQNDIFRVDVPPGTVTDGTVFLRLIARYGTFFVPNAEIGDTVILELGVIHGADLFGMSHAGVPIVAFNHPVEVCIRGNGAVYYRDATGVPRITIPLPTYRSGEYTCVQIPNAGTVVLTNRGEKPTETTNKPESEQTLVDCQVRVNNRVNLRREPGMQGKIITLLPYNIVLTALKRNGNWLYVDYLGQFGWVNSQYLTPTEGCGN